MKQPLLSHVYNWIINCKRLRETSEKQRIASPHIPLFSIGNVTFGATGKTPFVQFLLDYVLQHGKKRLVPMLLSRGYGDDEWRMLSNQFPACIMALGGDRVAIGVAKVKELGGDGAPLSCIVLDDGLQQWRLVKDLEIVMVDALHPLGNGLLLPWGSLREMPRDAFARADVVILHHANLVDTERIQDLMDNVRALMDARKKAIIATSKLQVMGLVSAKKLLANAMSSTSGHVALERDDDLLCLDGLSVLVVCGVGNPESVELVVKKLASWAQMEVIAFPDHHAFTETDVHDVVKRSRELQQKNSLVVLTTEKDFARARLAMQLLAEKVDLRVLQCKLELLHNCKQVKQRIDACLSKTIERHEQ
ncbi:unnamed protein product [Peronospora belbahrii]|uniref:tetraacyldisaccharide 4'-kinase n=1 Tax=Peronospora belbahrii TaxID=622444 RepID=A0AAU9L3V2_9STRA|nr:unnamed protein product [Peronospora belbahrii]